MYQERNAVVSMRSVIILAGGRSNRFGKDKGLVSLADKALIEHVYENVREVAKEVVVAISSKGQRDVYSRFLDRCTFSIDEQHCKGPLSGLWSALKIVKAKKVAIVACDMPFVSGNLLNLFFELCTRQDAVIPRWPNGYIEALHAVYDSVNCLAATSTALEKGCRNLRSMISNLHRILYVSTEVIREIQPELTMFTNINSRRDLIVARRILAMQSLGQSQ